MKTPPCPTDNSQSNIYSYQSFSQVSGSNNMGRGQKSDKNVKAALIGPGKPCESIGSVSDHEAKVNGGSGVNRIQALEIYSPSQMNTDSEFVFSGRGNES